MRIAVPKEILNAEKRVAAIPETVEKLRSKGFDVAVESGAGAGIFIDDSEYEKAGATIVKDVEQLFAGADIILKVKQPIFNEEKKKHEVEMMPEARPSSPSSIRPRPTATTSCASSATARSRRSRWTASRGFPAPSAWTR